MWSKKSDMLALGCAGVGLIFGLVGFIAGIIALIVMTVSIT